MKLNFQKILILICLGYLFGIQSIWAVGSAGYSNQIVGTKAYGMGNTFVATADDLTAIYFNPAGLTQTKHAAVTLGLTPLFLKTDYKPGSGANESMESYVPVTPQFYFSFAVKDKWRLGLGINSPFGLETHWGNNSALRYVATDSELIMINVNPTVAYEWSKQLSLGFGLNYARTDVRLRSRINQTALNTLLNGSLTASEDGGKKLTGDGQAWGYNAGVLWKPRDKHWLGLSYRSKLKTTVKGSAELSGLSDAANALFGGETYTTDVEADVRYPESVLMGYAFRPGKWIFEMDGEWVNYSTVDETNLTYTQEQNALRRSILNSGNPINRDWHTTWNLGVGANYTFNDTWQGRAGFFHYPKVIPNSAWEPGLPESSHDGYTVGATFHRPRYDWDAAYNYIEFDDRRVNNAVGADSLSSVNGTYQTHAHIFSLQATWRWGEGKD
jgi:long-chain fatty acid transport protein